MDSTVVHIFIALGIAGLIQGCTGFGFGLLSTALLPLWLPFRDALILGAIINVPVCSFTLATVYRHFRWKDVQSLVLGCAVGVPIGFYAMSHLKTEWLLRALGALLCVFSLYEIFLARHSRLRFPERSGFPVGLISGTLGGALNVGGPPMIAYVYSQTWAKERVVATLQVVFGFCGALRLIFMWQGHLLRPDLLKTGGLCLFPVLLGVWIGSRLLEKIPAPPLKLGVMTFLLTTGAKYLLFR